MRNYTSSASVSSTIGRIETILTKVGAQGINKKYKDGVLVSILFTMEHMGKEYSFLLPSNVEEIYTYWSKKVKRARPGTEKKLREQAARTAWKLLQDDLEIQLARLEVKQVEFFQVFLPYMYNGTNTVYDMFKNNEFKQLTGRSV